MQKRTSYEFEGKTGYQYVTKAYSNSDVKFEVHFRASENEVDTFDNTTTLRMQMLIAPSL